MGNCEWRQAEPRFTRYEGEKPETDLILCKCSRRLVGKSRKAGKLKKKKNKKRKKQRVIDSHSGHPTRSTVGVVAQWLKAWRKQTHIPDLREPRGAGRPQEWILSPQREWIQQESSEKWWHEQLTWGSQGVSNRRWPLTQVFKNDGVGHKWTQQKQGRVGI